MLRHVATTWWWSLLLSAHVTYEKERKNMESRSGRLQHTTKCSIRLFQTPIGKYNFRHDPVRIPWTTNIYSFYLLRRNRSVHCIALSGAISNNFQCIICVRVTRMLFVWRWQNETHGFKDASTTFLNVFHLLPQNTTYNTRIAHYNSLFYFFTVRV